MPEAERLSENEQLAGKQGFEGKREILREIFKPRAVSS